MSKNKKFRIKTNANVTASTQQAVLDEYEAMLERHRLKEQGIAVDEPIYETPLEEEADDNSSVSKLLGAEVIMNIQKDYGVNKETTDDDVGEDLSEEYVDEMDEEEKDLRKLHIIIPKVKGTTGTFEVISADSDFVILEDLFGTRFAYLGGRDNQKIAQKKDDDTILRDNLEIIQFAIAMNFMPSAILSEEEYEMYILGGKITVSDDEEIYVIRSEEDLEDDGEKVVTYAIYVINVESFSIFERWVDWKAENLQAPYDSSLLTYYALLYDETLNYPTREAVYLSFTNYLHDIYEKYSSINETFLFRVNTSGKSYQIPDDHVFDANQVDEITGFMDDLYTIYVEGKSIGINEQEKQIISDVYDTYVENMDKKEESDDEEEDEVSEAGEESAIDDEIDDDEEPDEPEDNDDSQVSGEVTITSDDIEQAYEQTEENEVGEDEVEDEDEEIEDEEEDLEEGDLTENLADGMDIVEEEGETVEPNRPNHPITMPVYYKSKPESVQDAES